MTTFFQWLEQRYKSTGSLLCVGLDPRQAKSGEDLEKFVKRIVAATSEYAITYKANAAFFERVGPEGYAVLSCIRSWIPAEIPLIIDAKRGDIASTADAYSEAMYTRLRADCVTINPYLGSDGIKPFTNDPQKGVFLLCRTSNPSGSEIQMMHLACGDYMYQHVAHLAKERWNDNGNVGLVVGATHPDELVSIRKRCPDMWILAPGIGAQGGDLESTLKAGYLAGRGGIIVNVSRGISQADDPQTAAQEYYNQIKKFVATLEK